MTDEWNNQIELSYIQPDTITFPEGAKNHDKFTVTKSNRLISAQTLLTAREQKLLAACISLINPRGQYPNGITVELRDEQIEALTGIEKRHIYRFIEEAAKAFHSMPIETPGKKEGTIDIINIAHRSRYDPETRKLVIQFHDDMKDELVQLSQYTSVELKYFVKLGSKYSMRLYELISKQYIQKKGGVQIIKATLESLYYPLGLKDHKGKSLKASYTKDYASFRLRVLEPACREISEKTNLIVSYKTYKVGRSVHGLIFSIQAKSLALESKSDFDMPEDYTMLNIVEAAKYLKINDSILRKWLDTHTEEDVKANIFMCLDKISDGHDIKNTAAYTTFLLKHNIARLPDIANPFSDMHKANRDSHEFARRIVVPIWWKLPKDLREELEAVSSFAVHLTTAEYYKGFVKTARESTYDEAHIIYDADGALLEWS